MIPSLHLFRHFLPPPYNSSTIQLYNFTGNVCKKNTDRICHCNFFESVTSHKVPPLRLDDIHKTEILVHAKKCTDVIQVAVERPFGNTVFSAELFPYDLPSAKQCVVDQQNQLYLHGLSASFCFADSAVRLLRSLRSRCNTCIIAWNFQFLFSIVRVSARFLR